MRHLILKLLLFVPISASIAWTNWTVDPAHFFRKREGVAREEQKWQRVVERLQEHGSTKLDHFIHHRYFFEAALRSKGKFDVVCYGTSVATPIHEGLFPGQTFFNASVMGSRLGTMIAVDQLFLDHDARAKTIVLVVDPWCLTGDSLSAAGFNDELCRALRRMHVIKPEATCGGDAGDTLAVLFGNRAGGLAFTAERGLLHPYDNLISVRYFQLSVQTAWETLRASPNRANAQPSENAPKGNPSDELTLFRDGSINWTETMRRRTRSDIRKQYSEFVYSRVRAQDLKMKGERFADLKRFVADLTSGGARVEIWLPPVSPWYYESVSKILSDSQLPSYFIETERLLRSLAATFPILVKGSYNPRKFGLEDQDFIDAYHMRREAMTPVWTQARVANN